VNQSLTDYFRLPSSIAEEMAAPLKLTSGDSGFFQFGPGNVCYGRSSCGVTGDLDQSFRLDVSQKVGRQPFLPDLPFSFGEVINNLRLERYRCAAGNGSGRLLTTTAVRDFYYSIREGLPIGFRRHLQKIYLKGWSKLAFPNWPVDFTVDNLHEEYLRISMDYAGLERVPFIWFWPDGASNCLILTHDVESPAGLDFTIPLIELDAAYGFHSSFQVIPEKRYTVRDSYLSAVRDRGCEVNIHDLNHDGRLYLEHGEFRRRAAKINEYSRMYGTRGFRSGSMYRNQDWFEAFDFSYDMSVPNVAHLEPMRGGCCTVMPYFVGKILELPLTTTQDYSLFHILKDYSIDLWKHQLDLLSKRNGLISFVTHPDYLMDRRAGKVYENFLEYARAFVLRKGIVSLLPGEVDHWWRQRNEMQLVRRGQGWEIVGSGSDRARIAYAVVEEDRLVYQLSDSAVCGDGAESMMPVAEVRR
jgi:hypothetical protein